MKAKLIVVLILIALFIVLLIQNTEIVTFRIFFWKVSMSQVILLPLALLIGFAVGYMFGLQRVKIRRKKIRSENPVGPASE